MTNATNAFTATATAATAAAPNLRERVMGMLGLIEEFGSLLVKETDALKKSDFRLVDLLQDDKRSLAKRYHAEVTALSERRNEMPGLDVSLQERLIKARTSFTVILNENLRALEASRDSARRLVNRILDTARKTVTDELQTSYSAKGHTQSYKSAPLSLSVDQSL